MKTVLIAGLLCLGIAVAEEAPIHPESIGERTWANHELKGKVKSLKKCDVSLECQVYDFNEYGVEIAVLQNRKLINAKDGWMVFERPYPDDDGIVSRSTFKGKLLVKLETVNSEGITTELTEIFYDEKGNPIQENQSLMEDASTLQLASKSVYQYESGRLVSKTSDLIPLEVVSVELFDENGFRKSIDLGDGPTSVNTYEMDAHGNWVKRYKNGVLNATREITYP